MRWNYQLFRAGAASQRIHGSYCDPRQPLIPIYRTRERLSTVPCCVFYNPQSKQNEPLLSIGEPSARSVRYSQKGMATTQDQNESSGTGQQQNQSSGKQTGFLYLPLIAGWLVPGSGHFLMKKWGRGALISVSIVCMYALGLAMQGKLYTSVHDGLDALGLVGDLGNGILFFISRALGLGADQVQVTTADYGTRFMVVAGLLNVIAAVDAHNLRTGRKS
jgi:hypothetical protein